MKRLALAALIAAVLGACTSRAPRVLPQAEDGLRFTYVAVGASESLGAGTDEPALEAWTSLLYREVMPRAAVFVNVAKSGSTVKRALEEQVPLALEQDPALVTVWLNVNDLVRAVPVAEYERDLGLLVHRLRRDGKTEVLVAGTPTLEDLPVVRACLPGLPQALPCRLPNRLPGAESVIAAAREYNAAIARVADREGAVLVDLRRPVGDEAGRGDNLYAPDGFHPSSEGHRAVADAFGSALRSAPHTGRFAARP